MVTTDAGAGSDPQLSITVALHKINAQSTTAATPTR